MSFRMFLMMIVLGMFAAGSLDAQTPPADPDTEEVVSDHDESAVPAGGMPRYIKPETPEQRAERLGTQDDPGINPDPDKIFVRFGKQYKIKRFEKKWARYTNQPGFIRPHGAVNFIEELYQENERYVWVWMPQATAPRRSKAERIKEMQYKKYSKETIDYLGTIRGEFTPLDPPASSETIRFEESSKGLPSGGSFRNSLAVADMNGDGHADLVVPAQRGSSEHEPSILLGDGKGSWTKWKVRWPNEVNYGNAVVADFNKDKKMDVAFGIHLDGLAILLGDGKGGFREVKRIRKFPTRRVVATDVDQDGWTDVVALFEGPLARGADMRDASYTNLRGFLNRKKGEQWEGVNISGPNERISGDWLAAANFNGDRYPDFVGSSMYFNETKTFYLSTPEKTKYLPLENPGWTVVPARASYHAVTAAPFTSRDRDDAVVASVRRWPDVDPSIIPTPPNTEVVSLDLISFAGGEAKRTPIIRFPPDRSISGLNHGDFNRDGKQDLIMTRHTPREAVILLGDGKGGFTRAVVEGLAIPPEQNYDIAVADVNADSRPDVILMYETRSGTALAKKSGKIQVFLNRGPA